MKKPWASPEIVEQITTIGLEAMPLEACGLVTPTTSTAPMRVVQLPNISPQPESSYEVDTGDLLNEISTWAESADVDPEELTREHFMVWHTHPSGSVGPSRADLQIRIGGFQYMVVTLPTGEAVIF